MKRLSIIGNVGRDALARANNPDAAFVFFPLAVAVGTKLKPKTHWVDVICTDKLANVALHHAKTGSKLYIEGFPVPSLYVNKSNQTMPVLKLYANYLEVLNSKIKVEADIQASTEVDEGENLHVEEEALEDHTTNEVLACKQSGFSLLDFILWLAVIGVLIGVIYGIYAPARTQSQAQAMAMQLQTLQEGIRTAYSGQPDGYADITTQQIIDSKLAPSDLRVNGGNLISNFAGKLSFSTLDTGQTFTITYQSVPSSTCQALLGKIGTDGWEVINVNSTDIWTTVDGTVPSKAMINSNCNASNHVSMAFSSN